MKTIQLCAILVLVSHCLEAQTPSLINYQGRLLDNVGNPVTTNVNVSIALYTNNVGGAAVYTENIGMVPVQNGLYSFSFGQAGTSIVQAVEQIGTGNGAQTVFTTNVSRYPVVNPSVTIFDGVYSWNDVSGSSNPGVFLGTATYANGSVSAIYLSGIPPAGRKIYATYSYNDAGIAKSLATSSNLYMAVSVNGTAMSPRQRLGTVAYSMVAQTVEGSSLMVHPQSGYVGVLNNNPSSPLTVNGVIETTAGGVRFPDGTVQVTAPDAIALRLDMNMVALSAEMSAFTSSSEIVDLTSNYFFDVFVTSNGINGSLFSASANSYISNRYDAIGSVIGASAQVSSVVSSYATVKTIPINGGVRFVTNELYGFLLSSTPYAAICRMKYNYSDGSTGYSAEKSKSNTGWASQSYDNPYPRKSINTVEVQLRASAEGGGIIVYERNTLFFHTNPAWFTLSIPSNGTTKASNAYVAIRGHREGNDVVTCTLTDGIYTTPAFNVNSATTIQALTNAPTRMTINMTPSTTNATAGGTSITTVVIKYW